MFDHPKRKPSMHKPWVNINSYFMLNDILAIIRVIDVFFLR